MTPKPLISLSDEEKMQLTQIAESEAELLTHRARLILAYAEGKPTLQAANEAGISRGRARYWKRQYLAQGMKIFHADFTETPMTEERSGGVESIADVLVPEMEAEGNGAKDMSKEAEIPFPQPREKIGITLDDTLVEAGKKVWSFYFAEMLRHETGTKSGEDIEELHDMRVATRRMRTAFDIFGPGFNPKIVRHHLKGLRKIGRALGQVRDMDVILANGITYQLKMKEAAQPGLEPLLSEWRTVIERQRVKMMKHLQSEDYNRFKFEFNLFLQPSIQGSDLAAQSDGRYALLRDTVPVLVYSRYAAVRAYETILPTATITQLHALRIEFKKFRYTLEYFKEILGDDIERAINDIKRMQDHLGELHDADVACQLVRGFLKESENTEARKPIVERFNPEPIVSYMAYLHAERYRLTSSFPEVWRKFNRPDFRQRIAQTISQL